MPDYEAGTNVLRTRLPLTSHGIATIRSSFDLHALDTPPAFILSQDQTLSKTHGVPGGTPGSRNQTFLFGSNHSSVVKAPWLRPYP